MPFKTSLNNTDGLTKWLNLNANKFLDPNDKIEKVVILKNTIKNDPNASGLGISFDHKYEIQPKAIFTTSDKSGNLDLGLIEISRTPIGLKDVGILHTYAKMVEPKYALLICENSYSKELTYLLTDPEIAPRLMQFTTTKHLKLIDIN